MKSGAAIPDEIGNAGFLNVKVFYPTGYKSDSPTIIISPFGLKPYLCA